jgi:hypothetical protein
MPCDRCGERLLQIDRYASEALRSPSMTQDVFERLRHAQIGEPIHQPLIFAILVILIAITLYFIWT